MNLPKHHNSRRGIFKNAALFSICPSQEVARIVVASDADCTRHPCFLLLQGRFLGVLEGFCFWEEKPTALGLLGILSLQDESRQPLPLERKWQVTLSGRGGVGKPRFWFGDCTWLELKNHKSIDNLN